jgi:hypothetical protein
MFLPKNEKNVFWTEFNPIKEEEYSVDPLGLQNYSEVLAEKILPGITSRTRKPRYFSFLCWCLQVIEKNSGTLGVRQFGKVEDTEIKLMQLEKLFVLSIIAYYGSKGTSVPNNEKPLLGIEKASSYFQLGTKTFSLGNDYEFLKNQRFLGCFGAYKTALGKIGFMDLSTYETTKDGDSSGENLANAFCRKKEIERIAVKSIRLGKIEREELVKLGKNFLLSPQAMSEREKNIFYCRLKEKYSIRSQTFGLFENEDGVDDLELVGNVLEKKIKVSAELAKILELIRIYEYFSIAVASIFELALHTLQQGKDLSELQVDQCIAKLKTPESLVNYLRKDNRSIEPSLCLLQSINNQLITILIPAISEDESEYAKSLCIFVNDVYSAVTTSDIADLVNVIIRRHVQLKDRWSWIANNTLTNKLCINTSRSMKVPKLHSYRLESLKQLASESR